MVISHRYGKTNEDPPFTSIYCILGQSSTQTNGCFFYRSSGPEDPFLCCWDPTPNEGQWTAGHVPTSATSAVLTDRSLRHRHGRSQGVTLQANSWELCSLKSNKGTTCLESSGSFFFAFCNLGAWQTHRFECLSTTLNNSVFGLGQPMFHKTSLSRQLLQRSRSGSPTNLLGLDGTITRCEPWCWNKNLHLPPKIPQFCR